VLYPYKDLANQLNAQQFRKHGSLFQFEALLPVGSQTPVDQAVGGTPLLSFEEFKLGDRQEHVVKRLLIKHDGISFSGSFKDRASVIAMNMALAEGYRTIYCASTGNAASSLALLTAHSALETAIFVPQSIPKGKLAQLLAAGAKVYPIAGTYDQAFDLSMRVGFKNGWYCRNSAINPYLSEGKKTAAFEILVQNNYAVPDYCLVGVGDGTVVSALIKGFEEFYQLGLVAKVPTVIGIQAAGAATVKRVFDAGPPFIPMREEAHTLADSICVGDPRDVIKACTYMQRNGGWFEAVSDQQIVDAMLEMTVKTGVFAEPAGAIPYAGLKQMLQNHRILSEHTVVLVVTGTGLKDPRPVEARLSAPIYSIDALEGLLSGGVQ